MKKYSTTYQYITKPTALLLLLAFLIPSGLQAKQFVDFCMPNSHSMEMEADHSCCESENDKETPSDKSHHDCAWMGICACNSGNTILQHQNWVLPSGDFIAVLTQVYNLSPFSNLDERIPSNQQSNLHEHHPPLWLVYDTLLI